MFSLLKISWNLKKREVFKKIGKVKILISDRLESPYSFSFFRKSYISIPIFLLNDQKSFTLAIKHELEHIRARHTFFSHLSELLSAMTVWNPIVNLWLKMIASEQEFACDEAILKKHKNDKMNYIKCLFKVAKTEMEQRSKLVGATGLFFGTSRSELSRRIEKMSKTKKQYTITSLALISLVPLAFTLSGFFIVKAHASFGQLSLSELESIVDKTDFTPGFPVDLNKDVLNWVNKYARSKKGASYSKKSLKNYKKYKDLVEKYTQAYQHPKELAAIPFVESQYINLKQPKNHYSAGLWQFIPSTARAYNLTVRSGAQTAKDDERLNVDKETDAAMRYLGALNLRFKDWRLAILSYNAGEVAVQNQMDKIQNRNPWRVAKSGLNYDKDYLARVIAASIVMKYPKLVK
jgi:hypothetical protein